MEPIGYIVWWDIHDSKITVEGMNDLFIRFGINHHMSDIPYVGRFNEAVQYFNLNEHQGKKFLLKRVRTAKNHLIYGLMEADISEEDAFAEYVQVSKVTFWSESGIIDCEPEHPGVGRLRELYHRTNQNVGDIRIRQVLLELFRRMLLVSVRSRAGVYLTVPSDHFRTMRLGKLIAAIPGDTIFTAVPVEPSDYLRQQFAGVLDTWITRRVRKVDASYESKRRMRVSRGMRPHLYMFMDLAADSLRYLYEIEALYKYDLSEYTEKIETWRSDIGVLIDEILSSTS